MKKVRVGIAGGAGYTGGELTRLLLRHPQVDIVFIQSKSQAGKSVSSVHGDLLGETELKFSVTIIQDMDVLFLCVGHQEAAKFLDENKMDGRVKIIDLSNDFRLKMKSSHNERQFIYGLPELNKDAIRKAHNVANPGCFATAIQLGLLPLAKAGILKKVFTTGITGSTGAGQGLAPTSHFSWRANNIQPYKTLTHQHLDEIGESLGQLQDTENISVNFIPWRGDFTRGIFVTSQMLCHHPLDEIEKWYREYYIQHPFVTISKEPIHLKQVVNTNKCVLQLEMIRSQLVIHSAIDNLLKGASGQAVQNMNLMFGLEETLGLQLKANYF